MTDIWPWVLQDEPYHKPDRDGCQWELQTSDRSIRRFTTRDEAKAYATEHHRSKGQWPSDAAYRQFSRGI